jgi:hypothetical protein
VSWTKRAPGHRLDDGAHRLTAAVDTADEADETVEVGRRLELLEDLALLREQADVEAVSAQIEPSLQRDGRASFGGSLVDAGSVLPATRKQHTQLPRVEAALSGAPPPRRPPPPPGPGELLRGPARTVPRDRRSGPAGERP